MESVSILISVPQVSEYNVPHGKKNRGLTVLHSYRFLAGDKCCAEEEELACVLGWCVEWVSAVCNATSFSVRN